MGKWMISKEFHFSASHQLTGLPEDHQCARLHGHNYILVVRLSSSNILAPGFVLDYGEMTFAKKTVDDMDHRHLNDLFDFNPTSELIIQDLHREFSVSLAYILGPKHDASEHEYMKTFREHYKLEVGLSETPKTWAWYSD